MCRLHSQEKANINDFTGLTRDLCCNAEDITVEEGATEVMPIWRSISSNSKNGRLSSDALERKLYRVADD